MSVFSFPKLNYFSLVLIPFKLVFIFFFVLLFVTLYPLYGKTECE